MAHNVQDIVIGGLIPGVGLLADIRDLGAAISHVSDGREGAWLELGASIVGFVPFGDMAKSMAKGATKAMAKTATHALPDVADDALKVVKGSTAAATDGLTSAQKTAGKVNAPRGPPVRGGETAAAAAGRRAHANYGIALGPTYDTRVRLPSGKKPDAVNWAKREVRELKPDNASAVQRGERQVEGYRRELEKTTGEPWTSVIDTYRGER